MGTGQLTEDPQLRMEVNMDDLQLTSRMKLLLSMLAGWPTDTAQAMKKHKTLDKLFALLKVQVEPSLFNLTFISAQSTSLPTWLCPFLLLVDQFERQVMAQKLRGQILALYPEQLRHWQIHNEYFWQSLELSTQDREKLNEAFSSGDASFRYERDHKFYTIHFGTMIFFCDETKQYCLLNLTRELFKQTSQTCPKIIMESYLNQPSTVQLLAVLVAILKVSTIKADTLEAVLRLALRLTRTHSMACLFSELGGIVALLDLPAAANFVGLEAFTTLLIRHVVENESVLRTVMINNFKWEASYTEKSFLEPHFTLSRLAPLAQRDLSVFLDVAKSTLRIENGSVVFEQPPGVETQKTQMCKEAKQLTKALLDLLPKRFAYELKAKSTDKAYVFSTSRLLHILAELCRLCDTAYKVIFEHHFCTGK